MRLSALLTAITGLAVAGGSVYVARDYVRIDPTASAAVVEVEETTVPVIVAARDIAFSEPLEAAMLTTIEWPKDAVPEGVFISFADLLANPGDPQRRARRPIYQGELILDAKISDYGEKVTIAQTLAPTNRAMAINVNAATAVGGFVTPGDRVDILLTQGSKETLRTVTILQNIRIVGVDQDANETEDSPSVARTVTVEVSPEQGQRLVLAQRAGELSLSLRSLEDSDARSLETVRLMDILQDANPDEELRPAPTIRVRRGNDLTETQLN